MVNQKGKAFVARLLRLVVLVAAYGGLLGGMNGCGDEDLVVPGQIPPTPRRTETPEEDDGDS